MSETTLNDRAVIRLSGENVRGFLQGLVTSDVAGALPVWTGLLTPQGKALFDFIVWADGEDVLIDCEAGQVDALARRLKMYRLRLPIEINIAQGLAIHWSATGSEGTPDPRDPRLGVRWIAPPREVASGWHLHRLSLGVPEGAIELGKDKTLWLECNARELNGVSFTKGCYVGQENTARMHHRGKVNRQLAVVPITEAGEAPRVAHPETGFAVIHRRIDEAR